MSQAISKGERPSLSVIQDKDKLQVFCPVPCAQSSLIAEVPMVHDVDIATSGDSSISCSNMVESDYCNIQVVFTFNCFEKYPSFATRRKQEIF